MIKIDAKTCLVAVISLLLGAIWHIPANAVTIESLGQLRSELSAPTRLDVDAEGRLYVADPGARAILRYDKYGRLDEVFDAVIPSGSGLAVAPDGSRIYVSLADEVAVVDGVTGELLAPIGAGGGKFVAAGFVDLDASGRVFVADVGRRSVWMAYDPQGGAPYEFALGRFASLHGMAVNPAEGAVYVADSMNGALGQPRVEVFNLAGTYLRTLAASTSFGSTAVGYFSGIAFQGAGRVYALDAYRSALRVVGPAGGYLGGFESEGFEVGQLKQPSDVAFDPLTSRLFITSGGARVEIFGVDGGQSPAYVNNPPSVPVPVSPIAGSEADSATPTLLFENALDADGDSLTYDVRLFQGETLVAEYLGLPEGDAISFANVGDALEENAAFGWAVQAFDGEEGSGYSAPAEFIVNAIDEAPEAPVLIAPLAGEILDGAGRLQWQAASDPDPNDTVSYRVSVAADGAFGEVVFEELLDATSFTLADGVAYEALTDGATYFWRVTALDNDGLASAPSVAGSFLYDTSVLSVTANMPGARVYLGGNHGYAGRYIGEAPLELRDLSADTLAVVVERAGFEPFVTSVEIAPRQNVAVAATLAAALDPAELKATAVVIENGKFRVGGDATPFAVDFDRDGTVDLLVGDAAGNVSLFPGAISVDGTLGFGAAVDLGLTPVPGAAPFVLDWDNDGRSDLLVGGADGTVTLYRNLGTEAAPVFGGGVYLASAGVPIDVGTDAVLTVGDLTGDGAKDLLVGSGNGLLTLFANAGGDAAVELAAGTIVAALPGAAAPVLADWDGDGSRELLLAVGEGLYRANRLADGTFALGSRLYEGKAAGDSKRGGGAESAALGDRLRPFALDLDGAKGKDLIVGNASGELLELRGGAKDPVGAFAVALLDKVAQIEALASEAQLQVGGLTGPLTDALGGNDLAAASGLAVELLSAVAGTPVEMAAGELDALLR